MTLSTLFGRTGRSLALAAAIAGVVGLTLTSKPVYAVSPGAAVGIGLGALAVGTVLGTAANPYPGYYPGYYYPPAPAYYAPGPSYYGPGPVHSCWSPYYGRYYPC
jgi:hypothetical protein